MPPRAARLPFAALAGRWLARRRFPTLFAVAALALAVDLVLPDGLPFLDEVLLAVVTAVLGSWRRDGAGDEDAPPPRAAPPR